MILQIVGNEPSPISVTVFGIVIFVSDEHPEKALEPISINPKGITTFFMFFHHTI